MGKARALSPEQLNKRRAAQGHADAQNNLGVMYAEGQDVPQDFPKAKEWWEKAAAQGYAPAQFNLGVMYAEGQGVSQDFPKAKEWWEKAAAQGYAGAQFNLGLMYDYGRGVPQDDKKAFEWYEKAAAQGNALAQNNLGMMYRKGQGVSQDFPKAKELWEKAAAQGNALAQNNLGVMYAEGRGVSQDYQKVAFWYEKAAAQGYAPAQNNLGGMYYQGRGVSQDYQKVAFWYEKAAAQGYAPAQFNLGVMYRKGQGVPQDYQKAFEWYEKAATQGDADAQNNLGMMYDYGRGVPQDDKKAFEWYEKAATQGHRFALFSLLVFLFTGKGTKEDLPRAKDICQQAKQSFTQENIKNIKPTRSKFRDFVWHFFRVNKGPIPRMRKHMQSLPPDKKKDYGKVLEGFNHTLQDYVRATKKHLDQESINDLSQETEDPNLEGILRKPKTKGSPHPLTKMEWDSRDYFTKQGFDVAEGPEIETEKFNFDDLNIPANHPAREMHDTFYMDLPPHKTEGRYLLRTHTSPVQIREMLSRSTPPFRLISHGRVYRCDSDRTHTPMFHQLEGLVIEKGIHMGHMRWIVQDFLKTIFRKSGLTIRLRPSYFPFTEPSVEVDMRFTEESKWLEIAGCGMVHPNVLRNCRIDPQEWQGFAFGFGLDRLTMLKYDIDDLRQLFRSDLSINVPSGASPIGQDDDGETR